MIPYASAEVENVYHDYKEPFRSNLLKLRELIYKVADKTEGVGKISESLKWGEPTYSTLQTHSGTPIRIDQFDDTHIGMFFHCQTSLIEQFREIFTTLEFSKNRAILLDVSKPLPLEELEFCILSALTYHKDNLRKSGI